MITKSKVVEIFCIADDFYKEVELEIAKRHLPILPSKGFCGRRCYISKSWKAHGYRIGGSTKPYNRVQEAEFRESFSGDGKGFVILPD